MQGFHSINALATAYPCSEDSILSYWEPVSNRLAPSIQHGINKLSSTEISTEPSGVLCGYVHRLMAMEGTT